MPAKYLIHDETTGRVKEVESIEVSSGSSDAGKLVSLGANGQFDPSVIGLGSGSNYLTIDIVNQSSVGLLHNFGRRPHVTFINTTGEEEEICVEHPTLNSVSVSFYAASALTPKSGTFILIG